MQIFAIESSDGLRTIQYLQPEQFDFKYCTSYIKARYLVAHIEAETVAEECVYLYWGRNCSGGMCIFVLTGGAGPVVEECVYLY